MVDWYLKGWSIFVYIFVWVGIHHSWEGFGSSFKGCIATFCYKINLLSSGSFGFYDRIIRMLWNWLNKKMLQGFKNWNHVSSQLLSANSFVSTVALSVIFLSLFWIPYRCYQTEKVENEATLKQLQQDLGSQKNHIEFLTGRLEEVCSDVESKCKVSLFIWWIKHFTLYSVLFITFSAFWFLADHYEIQGLRDCLLVEQDEKIELTKKLKDLEKECK